MVSENDQELTQKDDTARWLLTSLPSRAARGTEAHRHHRPHPSRDRAALPGADRRGDSRIHRRRPYERTSERTTTRNGSRRRCCRPRLGIWSCGSRSCGRGRSFPSLLERRRRVDQALFAVVMEAYLHGVSTRKVDDLVKALGADTGISKSEVVPHLPRARRRGRIVPRPLAV
ncbi:transposase [Microbacterium sp. NRRL B-14842]|uniref:transposase n=1 Tax=Microbacterium sp. NRRL B-14842 TaxID=3162881 RepID=UPI003D26AEFC